MAFEFLKLGFLNRLDARARVAVLVLGLVGFILLVYFGTTYFFGGGGAIGPSRVAGAPPGLQSVPGGTLTPAYTQAIEQANIQRAEQARMRGETSVPTIIRPVGQPGAEPCTIICAEKSANVKDLLDDWTRQGKMPIDVANALQELANKNVTPEEYAAALDQLVKEGKITPEQARELLAQYNRQHSNALLQESANEMDRKIKSGELPLATANVLLTAQKNRISPNDFAALQQRLMGEGKLSQAAAQQLLTSYTQQVSREVIERSIATLQKMGRSGELIPEVEKGLSDLERQMIPINAFSDTLNAYVSAGKLTPIVAKKVLDEYKAQKAEIGAGGAVDQLVNRARTDAFQEINDLVKAAKMPPDVAAQLTSMIQRDVPLTEFKTAVDQFVKDNKITPEIGQLKKNDYQKIDSLKNLQQQLSTLQANNVSPTEYADMLKKAVEAGLITPEQAAQLMRDYQAMSQRAPTPTGPAPAMTPEFAALQESLAKSEAALPAVTPEEFVVEKEKDEQALLQQRQGRIDTLMAAMAGQAQQLIEAWQPPTLEHQEREPPKEKPGKGIGGENGGIIPGRGGKGGEGEEGGIPLIKAGTIIFGVLETAVNSDFPDSPVMVTIVEGKYKGAKLLGKLAITKTEVGQMDRVSLTFNLMNMDEWPRSKTITAFAIDPDTARTAIASHVNYHYLQRYGAIFATSFLEGYGNAVTTSGSTTTTGIFGTSTTHPEFSAGEKVAAALGQVGTNLASVAQKYVERPPTVRVDSGVSLGILFMADVT